MPYRVRLLDRRQFLLDARIVVADDRRRRGVLKVTLLPAAARQD